MTPDNFAYWLNGFFELSNSQELTKEQVAIIKEHLQLVFQKETKLSLEGSPFEDSADIEGVATSLRNIKCTMTC